MKAHASEPFLLAKQGVDMPLVNFFLKMWNKMIPSPLHSHCYQSLFNRMTELTQTCGDRAAEGLEVSGGP